MPFQITFKKSLLGLGISVATVCNVLACSDSQSGCSVQAAETPKPQIVMEAFLSACHTSPDPASMNYYLDQLESGAKTADEVKASIAISCTASKTANACQHVSGLEDLCKTTNN